MRGKGKGREEIETEGCGRCEDDGRGDIVITPLNQKFDILHYMNHLCYNTTFHWCTLKYTSYQILQVQSIQIHLKHGGF